MKKILKFLLVNTCIMLFTLNLYAQDLTGTWVTQQTVNDKKLTITLALSKTSTGYVGIWQIKESIAIKINPIKIDLKHPLNTRINAKTNIGEKKESTIAQMVGSFSGGLLKYADMGIIGESKLDVKLDAGSFKYVKAKDKEQLLQITGDKFQLTKKSSDFPIEYVDYKKDIIEVGSFKFINSEKSSKVKYNDRGILSFSVNNSSEFDLQRINITLKVLEQQAEIQGLEGNNGTFSLAKSKSLNPEIDIYSGFNLPSDSIHFTAVGSFNDVTLFTKTISLATIPFYLTDKTTINKSSDQILSVVAPYYGFNKIKNASIAAPLNQLVVGNHKMAKMWKAAFLATGNGGYEQDAEAAKDLASSVYKDVLAAARKGDAEAQYLMYYTVGLELTNDPSSDIAGAFLKKSADAGFLPAMYDYSLYLMRDSAYDDSYNYLMKCYNKGIQKAAVTIGYFYQKGYALEKDFSKAIEWYEKGDAFGDPDAMMKLAKIYNINDDNHHADPKKVVFYATKAATLKSTVALDYLAKIYLNGRIGVTKNIPKALALYKESAALGSNLAMSSLAYLYFKGAPGVAKDEKLALGWAKKSAQAGGADCMALLAEMYDKGIMVPKDAIIGRFWANQARLNGTGESDNTAQQAIKNDMMNILTNIDLRDQIVTYENTVTGQRHDVNEGPDLIGGIFKSFIVSYAQSRENQQVQINGAKHIFTTRGKKIYGATLSSKITTDIMLNEGEKIKLLAYGGVKLGFGTGIASPDGIGGYQSYCIDPSLPHGSVIIKVGGKWVLAGSNRTFVAPADGILQIAINDTDYTNNQGYFDLVISVDK